MGAQSDLDLSAHGTPSGLAWRIQKFTTRKFREPALLKFWVPKWFQILEPKWFQGARPCEPARILRTWNHFGSKNRNHFGTKNWNHFGSRNFEVLNFWGASGETRRRPMGSQIEIGLGSHLDLSWDSDWNPKWTPIWKPR